jgi:hypothetical protein
MNSRTQNKPDDSSQRQVRKQTVSQQLAKAIMPTGYYFGPEDWFSHFGERARFTKEQLSQVAEIPWSEEELKDINLGPSFLFLGAEKLDGENLDLNKWRKIFPGPEHPMFWETFIENTTKTCQLRWYLVKAGSAHGPPTLSYDCQVAMLPDEYEVPNAIEWATANILFYLLNGKYLNEHHDALTNDETYSGYHVTVSGSPVCGLEINHWYDDDRAYVGVAISRKSTDS